MIIRKPLISCYNYLKCSTSVTSYATHQQTVKSECANWQKTHRKNVQVQKSKLVFPTAASIVDASPDKIKPYLQLMRADKPIGTWLLYWPCTWSIAIAAPAGHLPAFYMLGLFGAGSFLMRSAGCVINDLWDKDFDKRVERTKLRPLACGSLSEKQAVGLLAGLLSGSLAILLQLNWYSVAVGASSMLLVVGYPLAKRFTYWPQFILGLTFNWGALLGWCAMRGDLNSAVPFLLYLAALKWTLIYDTIYAHQDKADDIMIGVKSSALRLGDDTKKWLSVFGIGTVASLSMTGVMSDQTWPYYLSLAATAGHLGWQIGTVDINKGEDCWKKFKSNSWMGVILFAGIVASTLLKEEKEEATRNEVNDSSGAEYSD